VEKNKDSKLKNLLAVFYSYTGWSSLIISGLLNLIIIFSWIFKSDSFSALNIPPIWVWGAIGIFLSFVSRLFKRTKQNGDIVLDFF